MNPYLIITNGGISMDLIAQLGLPADLLSWDDVLHDGSLRFQGDWQQFSAQRVRALVALGFGEQESIRQRFAQRDTLLARADRYREVVLWFEHDLYDQLQLLQVICQLGDRPAAEQRISTILTDHHISSYPPEGRQAQWHQRQPLSDAQRLLAHDAWLAFTAEEPTALHGLSSRAEALPHLGVAIQRWLHEFPDQRAGLSLTERYILESVSELKETGPGPLFGRYSNKEQATFMGDWSFWRYVGGLTQGPAPALRTRTGAPLVYPPAVNGADFLQQSLLLTGVGKALLAGEYQWFCQPWQQRWLGGVCQRGGEHWRWHTEQQRFYQVCLTG